MTTTAHALTVPPMRTVAPTYPTTVTQPATPSASPLISGGPVAPAPAAVAADPLALVLNAPDPTAELSRLVLAVSSRADTAAHQGQILAAVKGTCELMLKNVRTALLGSVADPSHPDGRPGIYDGFTVTEKAGSRSISYTQLQERHPDVYDEMVRVGNPSLTVSYTA